LHEWWRVARKKGWMSAGQPWLFPGYRGQHTSARQLHRIVRLAAGRAGITRSDLWPARGQAPRRWLDGM
jgi:hypothetical protein